MTKEELISNIAEKYSANYEIVDKLDEEINAITKKKILSKIGLIHLFGVIPALIISFINSRLCINGIIDISMLPIINCAGTVGVALLNNALYERKNNYKKDKKKYKLSNNERELLEREVKLSIDKKRVEAENNILEKYYHELNDEKNIVVNDPTPTEEEIATLEELKNKMELASKRMYINDRLCDYKNGTKTPLKSFVYGGLIGLVVSLLTLYLPHLMLGVIVDYLPTYAVLLSFASLAFGGAINLNNTIISQKLYDEKNKELGSMSIPSQKEPQFIASYSLLADASKEYFNALKKKDGVSTEIKEEIVTPIEEEASTPIKEEVVKLEKKY